MWKAEVGHSIPKTTDPSSDDWDTDPDFINAVSEKDQRWATPSAAKTTLSENEPQLKMQGTQSFLQYYRFLSWIFS